MEPEGVAPPDTEWNGANALRKKATTAQPKKLVIKGFKGKVLTFCSRSLCISHLWMGSAL